jgi:hypothetical protein
VYDAPDIAGARGFSQVQRSDAGSTVSHGVVFVHGDRFYLVFVSARDSAASVDDANTIASVVSRYATGTR